MADATRELHRLRLQVQDLMEQNEAWEKAWKQASAANVSFTSRFGTGDGIASSIEILLRNLVRERTGWRRWFSRWDVSHEPLRADAMRILHRIAAFRVSPAGHVAARGIEIYRETQHKVGQEPAPHGRDKHGRPLP